MIQPPHVGLSRYADDLARRRIEKGQSVAEIASYISREILSDLARSATDAGGIAQ